MKKLRIKAVIYSILGIVILTLYLVTVDFVKARWERYDAPTGLYTKSQEMAREVIEMEARDYVWDKGFTWCFFPGIDSTKRINDSTIIEYLSRNMLVDVYVPVTKRKTRRK